MYRQAEETDLLLRGDELQRNLRNLLRKKYKGTGQKQQEARKSWFNLLKTHRTRQY